MHTVILIIHPHGHSPFHKKKKKKDLTRKAKRDVNQVFLILAHQKHLLNPPVPEL